MLQPFLDANYKFFLIWGTFAALQHCLVCRPSFWSLIIVVNIVASELNEKLHKIGSAKFLYYDSCGIRFCVMVGGWTDQALGWWACRLFRRLDNCKLDRKYDLNRYYILIDQWNSWVLLLQSTKLASQFRFSNIKQIRHQQIFSLSFLSVNSAIQHFTNRWWSQWI